MLFIIYWSECRDKRQKTFRYVQKVIRYFRFHTMLVNDLHSMFPFLLFFFFAKRIFATRSLIMYNAYVFIYKDMWHLYFIHSGFTFFFFFIAFLFRQKCMEGFFFHHIYMYIYFIYIKILVKSYKANDESWIFFLCYWINHVFFSFHDTFHSNKCFVHTEKSLKFYTVIML